MAKFQLLACKVALYGDQNQIVHRGGTKPVTYPEVMLLRLIHGGEGTVTDLVVVGEVERDEAEERMRLGETYGDGQVMSLFPQAIPLPLGDELLPTQDEVDEGLKAMKEAQDDARAKRKAKPKARATSKKAPDPEPNDAVDNTELTDL